MARTKAQKLDRPARHLEHLRGKRERHQAAAQAAEAAATRRQLERALDDAERHAWTDADTAAEYKALTLLAEANEKTMTVEQARAWAMAFIESHPQEAEWAWRFVGRVEVHQRSRRGPPPASEMQPVDSLYDPIVKTAARMERLCAQALSREEITKLLERTNGLCSNKLPPVPELTRSQLRIVIRRVLPVR